MADERSAGANVPVKPRTCLSINILVLRLLGVWFPEEQPKTWRSKAYILYAICTQGTVYYVYMLTEFGGIVAVFGNIEKMAEASFLFLTHAAQIFKNYYFYTRSDKMVQFLCELEDEIFTPKNEKQRKILKWAMTRARSDSVILHSMAIVTCGLWAIFPFIEKTDENIRLPLGGWFPVDTTVSPNFEIVFCYQMLCVTCDALSNISMDTVATGLFIHICGQIDMLKDSLENMKENAVSSLIKKKQAQYADLMDASQVNFEQNFENGDNADVLFTQDELENEMQITYKKCVIHHEEIIRYSQDIEEIFNMCFLAQFSASVVIICLTLFKLTLVQSIFSLEFVSLVLYQACIVFELLLYCWHGNEMILKSDSISNSIYNSKWYEFSPKFSRNIILLMVRSKRPIRATSGKFFLLSLSTFTGILRLSWSYFAVLNRMHEEKET